MRVSGIGVKSWWYRTKPSPPLALRIWDLRTVDMRNNCPDSNEDFILFSE